MDTLKDTLRILNVQPQKEKIPNEISETTNRMSELINSLLEKEFLSDNQEVNYVEMNLAKIFGKENEMTELNNLAMAA